MYGFGTSDEICRTFLMSVILVVKGNSHRATQLSHRPREAITWKLVYWKGLTLNDLEVHSRSWNFCYSLGSISLPIQWLVLTMSLSWTVYEILQLLQPIQCTRLPWDVLQFRQSVEFTSHVKLNEFCCALWFARQSATSIMRFATE